MSSSNISLRQTIALTAVGTALVTTGAIIGGQAIRRYARTEKLKESVYEDLKESDEPWISGPGNGDVDLSLTDNGPVRTDPSQREWEKGQFDEDLIREQLSRNYSFLGEEGMAKLRNSYVVIVGCGGVGSWCALMLLRSGVERLLLIDFDMTTLSSLNRHAAATMEDVGTPKVEATRKYLKKIAPWARIDTKVGLWKKGEASESWLDGADWVVDAIDNVPTKVDLLAHCHKKNIKVFASMGAGAKSDPTRIQIADISNTYEDPLAKQIRVRLRKLGVTHGIPVVYSFEVPGEIKLLPLPDEEFEKGKTTELSPFDDFRVRILPVLGPLPSIFGLHAATYIMMDLAGKPLEQALPVKHRWKLYDRLERGLAAKETKLTSDPTMSKRCPLNPDDIAYIFEDLNLGRSSLPPHHVQTKPALIRWYKDQPVSSWNCAVMSYEEADKHLAEVLMGSSTGEELWGKEAERAMQKRAQEAKRVFEWRLS